MLSQRFCTSNEARNKWFASSLRYAYPQVCLSYDVLGKMRGWKIQTPHFLWKPLHGFPLRSYVLCLPGKKSSYLPRNRSWNRRMGQYYKICAWPLGNPSTTLKDSFCVAGRKTRNPLTSEADLYLAGITQLVTVLLADSIHQHKYIRSLKPLISA